VLVVVDLWFRWRCGAETCSGGETTGAMMMAPREEIPASAGGRPWQSSPLPYRTCLSTVG
jgi:hypothetical protein